MSEDGNEDGGRNRVHIDRLYTRTDDLNRRVTIAETKQAHYDDSIKRIETSVDKINANISRFIWAVALLFLAAAGQWVLNGGLAKQVRANAAEVEQAVKGMQK